MVCHFLPTLQIGGPIFTAEQADVLRGKVRSAERMKWDYEDEGTRRLNMCVNGTLDFSFPISALMICLRLLPWRSARLLHASLITRWQQQLPVHVVLSPSIFFPPS